MSRILSLRLIHAMHALTSSEPRRNGTETDGKETPVVGRVAGEAKVDTGKNPCGQQFFSNVNVARRLNVSSHLFTRPARCNQKERPKSGGPWFPPPQLLGYDMGSTIDKSLCYL